MTKLLLKKLDFFSLPLFILLLGGLFYIDNQIIAFTFQEIVALTLIMLSFIINFYFFKSFDLTKNIHLYPFILLLFYAVATPSFSQIDFAVVTFLFSIFNFRFNLYKNSKLTISIVSISIFIINTLYFPSILITILLFVYYLSSLKKMLKYFIFSYALCFIVLSQILILTENILLINEYFCAIESQFEFLNVEFNFLAIPLGILLTIGIFEYRINSRKISIYKRNLINSFIVLTLILVLILFLFNQFRSINFMNFLIPFTLISGNLIYYTKKFWLKETYLAVLLLAIIGFRIKIWEWF